MYLAKLFFSQLYFALGESMDKVLFLVLYLKESFKVLQVHPCNIYLSVHRQGRFMTGHKRLGLNLVYASLVDSTIQYYL